MGHGLDPHGEPFFINTVIGHLWHLIPGAHYKRMRGDDPNPRVYELIDHHADHVHWATGEHWTAVRNGATDATHAAGGGHAHVGLLIYQGGQWPESWHGKLLTSNFHGRRFNIERLERTGSGFAGRHEPDAFQFPDPWFRGVDLIAAPDGGVFVSDWSDAGECHDKDGVSRTTGRIFKISYGAARPRSEGDLAQLPAVDLARLQLSPNDWLARTARRVLADRAITGADLREGLAELSRIESLSHDPVHRLRALWARHVAGASDPARLERLLADPNERIRAWAIRLLIDSRSALGETAFSRLVSQKLPQMAAKEPGAFVRLTLASALQKIPTGARGRLASELLRRSEDADDHNLPLMLWYGIEPLAAAEPGVFDNLTREARLPLVQRLGARRLTEEIDVAPARLASLLDAIAAGSGTVKCGAVIDGISAALKGRRNAPEPAGWAELQAGVLARGDRDLIDRVRELSVVFGDEPALVQTREIAMNDRVARAVQQRALQTYVDAQPRDWRDICERLLRSPGLAATAAIALAQIDEPGVAERLLSEWPHYGEGDKPSVMSALLSRPGWAAKVLDVISRGTLDRTVLSASHAAQIRAFKQPKLTERLSAVLSADRSASTPTGRRSIEAWKRRLTPAEIARADLTRGRTLFRAVCAACHTLNGEGGSIGPDLTGSNRDNLDYLLGNIINPSAVLADAYRQTLLTMKDGRVLAGVVHDRSGRTLKLQTMSETLSIDANDIAAEQVTAQSLMPEGLLDALGDDSARDLVAYVMSKNP